ncbi:YfgM family protein [Cobetia crustatorum]|uniref:YfgM family protein n=1 Tax=Cobetia crustatorum TaxID=553385 RepID=UPI00046A309B|nr:tetratricopeptide repeat protein [Cobetia crustatorum]
MAEELRSEEEQLDAIKRWWGENGKSLIAGVVLAGAGVFAFKAWQNYDASQSEAASLRYQQLVSLVSQPTLDDAGTQQARKLIGELESNHGDSLYTQMAHLLDASMSVKAEDLDMAAKALQSVRDSSDDSYLQGLASLRLARIEVGRGDNDKALSLLKNPPAPLAAQAAAVRGDALVAQDKRDEAIMAYQEASSLSQQSGQPIYGLDLKLADLAAESSS